MSTTFEIGRCPAAISLAFSHGGEGPIVTFSNTRAVKRGQSSGQRTSMLAASTGPGAPGSPAHGGFDSGAPVAAWASRATP